jgi:hypothetical protein
MTATRTLITVGEGAAVSDIQRISDAAAYADDRAHEVIFTPNTSGVQKRVVPLTSDSLTSSARFMVVPGTAAGTVQVLPARFIAGTAPYTIAAAMSSLTAVQSPTFANNPGGTRTDQVYATVSLTSTTATRKSKDLTSAVVGSSPVVVEQHPTLTVSIAQGTSGGAAGTVPADSANVYNFPLASVTLPSTYVNTTPITQAIIAQTYERGWMSPQRVQAMRPMSIFSGSDPHKPTTPLGGNSRWGAISVFYGGWTHTTASQAAVTLDASIDWSRRFIWGHALYVGSPPEYTGTFFATTPNQADGAYTQTQIPIFIGTKTLGVQVFKTGATTATPANTPVWKLVIAADGSMTVVQNDSLAPIAGTGDYAIILFCTDQFVF